ncbi:MAG: NAD-dependent epimerase/dehydratase family protein [Alcanivorax sediminis]|uniref:NAD-dependent epimerase/dehydratase family protein n=1 Tax=Alcanivorax sediminis TaxID=2663008 RepID=UPI003C5789C7
MTTTMPTGSNGQQPAVPTSVFVTGAGGFIGRAIMARYQALGCDVRGMDLNADESANIVAGDITNPSGWAEHAKGCELFIHTAAIVSLAAQWPAYRKVTVEGTRQAIDVAVAAGAKRFVHFSSIAAMGYDYPDGADETCPVVIGNEYLYGVAKGASEHVALAAHAAGEIDVTIIRPGDVYGPGSRAWLIEPLKMARSGQLVLPDNGQGVFTPVYIEDLLDGIMLAAGLEEGRGQIFILWGGEAVSCKEFFSHHWHWAGRKGAPHSLPLKAALALTTGIWKVNQMLKRHDEVTPDTMLMFSRKGAYSIEKAQRLLGYQPKVNFAEGMRQSELWLRACGELEGKA